MSLPLVGFFVQPRWGIVADRSGLRIRVLAVLASGSAAGYFFLACVESFLTLVYITVLFAFLSRALIPMAVSVSLAVLQGSQQALGIVRAFGTLGFFCAVIGFPWLLAAVPPLTVFQATPLSPPSEPQLGILFPLAAGLTLCATVSALTLPHRGSVALRALQDEWRSLLFQGPFLCVTLVGFLAFLFLHGPWDSCRRRPPAFPQSSDRPRAALPGPDPPRPDGHRALSGGTALSRSNHTTPVALNRPGPLQHDQYGLGGCSSLMTGVLLEQTGINAPYLVGGAGALLLALLLPSPHPPLSQGHG